MSTPAAQVQSAPPQILLEQAQEQQNNQKILRAVQVGIVFLGDETVVGPIKYAEGIADLKWLLRNLVSGTFGINLSPNAPQMPIVPNAPPPAQGDGEDTTIQ